MVFITDAEKVIFDELKIKLESGEYTTPEQIEQLKEEANKAAGKALGAFIKENALAGQIKSVNIGLGCSDRVDEWERELTNA